MQTELYNLPTHGKDSGAGTFEEGTLTKIEGGYHIEGGSEYGHRYATYVPVVYVGYQVTPEMSLHETKDMAGMDFRLGDGELHLRESRE